jgi:hypothetical protein
MAKKTKTSAKRSTAKRATPEEKELSTPAKELGVQASNVATKPDAARAKKGEHSMGGMSHRDDPSYLGVDMLPGDPSEPSGPEDALGPGPKRGDYEETIAAGGVTHTSIERNEDGEIEVVYQNERASNRGDTKGKKGGVETTEKD